MHYGTKNFEINRLIDERISPGGDLLDLSDLGLKKIPKQLRELKNIAWLNLSNNKIKVIPDWFYNMPNLIFIDLSYNKLNYLPIRLFLMPSLLRLDYSNNDLSNLKYWGIEKSNIQILDLSNTLLGYVPEQIRSFSEIKRLILSDNYIKIIPNWLNELTSLRSIDFSNNYLKKYPDLKGLTKLRNIHLGQNQINKLPNWINCFFNLEILTLYKNGLSELPESFRRLKNLKRIDLALNKFSNIPSQLESLPKIIELDLSYNGINEIGVLNKNSSLKVILLNGNYIQNIKPFLELATINKLEIVWEDNHGSTERCINLKDNPIESPPIEIIKEGNEAILNYFRQLEEEQGKEDYLFETKLLIIGEAGAGKTTFAKRIKKKDADMPGEGDSTHGINVDKWEFEIPEDTFKEINHHKTNFHVNLWDFGGQEVYHGTHQFFFSKKSLYVLLCDTREQKTDFRYWLNTVEQICGEDAHLFILFNRREDHDWQLDAGFRERFKKLIKEEYSLDLSIVESIPELQRRIKGHLQRLPDVGQKLIQSWVDIREDLAKETANDISFERFKEICAVHKRTREDDIRNISQYFDQIGVFTHYIDDVVLRERVYLNSNHLVKTIYQLLDNVDIKAFNGRIGKKEIERVWEKLGFEKERLPRLLEKFGLMYQVPKQAEYIVPEHLPDGAPYAHWPYESEQPQLHFRYEFDKYMPKGLMSRLIVALHHYIGDHSLVWRRGVNLYHGGAHAEITESLGGVNRFDIRIVGDFRRDLLVIINQAFDNILREFQKLSVSREVQCPCDECQKSTDPYFHKMKDIEQALIKKARKPNPTVECKVSYEDVEIVRLLGMINYEWVLMRAEERSREEGFQLEIKSMLQTIKLTVEDTNRYVKNINKSLLATYHSLQNDLTHISNQVFESTKEEKLFLEKLEKRLSPEEKQEILWHDSDIKHKIKVTLPLLFVKYEAEMDVSGFKMPSAWGEFKRWFIQEVD